MSYEFLKKVMLSNTTVRCASIEDYFKTVFINHNLSDIEFEIIDNEDTTYQLKVTIFKDNLQDSKINKFKDIKDKLLTALEASTQFEILSPDWTITEDENEFQASLDFKSKSVGSSKIEISEEKPDLSKYATDNYGDKYDNIYSKAKKGGKQQQKIINLRYGKDILRQIEAKLQAILPGISMEYGDDEGRLMGGYNAPAGYPILHIHGNNAHWDKGFTIQGTLDNTNYKILLIKASAWYKWERPDKDILEEFDLADFNKIFEEYFNLDDIEVLDIGLVKNPKAKNVAELLGKDMSNDIWKGDFTLDSTEGGGFSTLENLQGMPKEITGDLHLGFKCTRSTEGCTQKVNGNFSMWVPGIRKHNLIGLPSYVGGDYIVRQCSLASLEGAPEHIYGDFNCTYNNLRNFQGAPKRIDGSFYGGDGDNAHVSSLKGLPSYIGGTLNLNIGDFSRETEKFLDNLKYLPEEVGSLHLWWHSYDELDKNAIEEAIQDLINANLIKIHGTVTIG